MKMCTGFMWLMMRHRSGFCRCGKEASYSTADIYMTQMYQNVSDHQIRVY
jgi:hypothetical protein